MTAYITEASVERGGVEIPLRLSFKARRDDGALLVDAASVTAFTAGGDRFTLRKVEMLAFAVELEREAAR